MKTKKKLNHYCAKFVSNDGDLPFTKWFHASSKESADSIVKGYLSTNIGYVLASLTNMSK